MTLVAAEIALVAEDLRARFVPAGLARVRSLDEEGLLLELKAHRRIHRLLVSLEPTATRLHLVEKPAVEARTAEGFARAVHQALAGTTLRDVEQLGGDRAVRLAFGDPPRALTLELTGRHANAFLLDEQGIIRSSFRPSQSRKRRLLWGCPYQPPIPLADAPWRKAASRFPPGEAVHAAIAAAYVERAARAVVTAARRASLGRLRIEVRRLERLAENLRRELAEAAEAEVWRRRGELLKTAGDVPRGTRAIRVTDWFAPGTPEVEIPLDPALGLRENMRRCFARARKLGRRPEALAPRLAAAERELATSAADLDRIETAPWDDSGARAAVARWAPPAVERPSPKRGREEPRVPYRAFRAADGHEILVGRSARDNDRLTFQVARGFDTWLHAAGAAGSHVILRVPKGREPTEVAVRDAALLALHYSKLGRSGEGEVHVTRRADVRRVRGGAPGQVTIARERRVWVRIDPARLRELLGRSAGRGQ